MGSGRSVFTIVINDEPRLTNGETSFSDESKFCLQPQDSRISVWRCRGEHTLAACIRDRHTGPSPGVIVWNAIGYTIDPVNCFSDFRFVVEPSDTIVIKDKPALLNCSTHGNFTDIKWKKDGTLLELSDEDDRRVVLPNGSLLFKRVLHSRTERPDEGLYQCIVSLDDIGTIISREAKLQIASLPPFDQSPEDVAVYADQTAYFPCSVHAMPPAKITWLKNQQPIHLDETRMTILSSGALELDSVLPSDEGTYQCVAVNSEKLRESSGGTLFVNKNHDKSKMEPPHFVAIPPQNVVVLKGSDLTLDCAANGNPKPRITWLKDGSTIDLA
ncbi:netrin receptor DCC [Trichonephila clavipes]|nr:netrin receptor DCC [Trichonephila clavipes]